MKYSGRWIRWRRAWEVAPTKLRTRSGYGSGLTLLPPSGLGVGRPPVCLNRLRIVGDLPPPTAGFVVAARVAEVVRELDHLESESTWTGCDQYATSTASYPRSSLPVGLGVAATE